MNFRFLNPWLHVPEDQANDDTSVLSFFICLFVLYINYHRKKLNHNNLELVDYQNSKEENNFKW